MYHRKKIAPEAGTPETKSRNNISINSILKNGGKVKVVLQRPGEIPDRIRAEDIPPEFLSKNLRAELMVNGLTFVYEPKSREHINISYGCQVYRGTVLVVNKGIDRLHDLSVREINEAVVWLMRRRV